MNKFVFAVLLGISLSAMLAVASEPGEHVKYEITEEVWFDIAIRETKGAPPIRQERVVIGVFGEICPMTATNFVQLAKGVKRDNAHGNKVSGLVLGVLCGTDFQVGRVLTSRRPFRTKEFPCTAS